MKITTEMVDYISALARLQVDEGEKEAVTAELERIVSYMDRLNELDTNEIEALSHVFPIKNIMRPDKIAPSFSRELLLQNSPGSDEEAFLVPKAVD